MRTKKAITAQNMRDNVTIMTMIAIQLTVTIAQSSQLIYFKLLSLILASNCVYVCACVCGFYGYT